MRARVRRDIPAALRIGSSSTSRIEEGIIQSFIQCLKDPLFSGQGKKSRMILRASVFAGCYHQQYLTKNPDGYCGLKGGSTSSGRRVSTRAPSRVTAMVCSN